MPPATATLSVWQAEKGDPMPITDRTATELLAELHAGGVTSVELTRAFLDQIDRHDGAVRAFLRVDPAAAMARAEQIDRRRAAGQPLGLLAGLPVAIKDVLCTQGEPTTCASRILENFCPPYDATVVARLKAADAVLIGKTNMDEFAMGGSNENSAFFPTRNPWDPTRDPRRLQRRLGGLRRRADGPAGGRHRHGRLDPLPGRAVRHLRHEADLRPRQPLRAGGLRQQPGPDRPLGPDGRGPGPVAGSSGRARPAGFHVDRPAGAARTPQTVRQPLEGLRLGLVREHFGEGLDAEVEAAVREAVARLRVAWGEGHVALAAARQVCRGRVLHHRPLRGLEQPGPLRRRALRLPHRRAGDARPSWTPSGRSLRRPAAKAALATLDNPLIRMYRRSRAEGFGAEVKRRIMIGTYALSAGYYDAYYKKALQGAAADPAGFRPRLRRGRPDRRPGDAHARLQDRREDRRPAVDVPVRPLHGQREPGRHRRDVDSLRLQFRRAADRPALAGPAVRGRAAVARRPDVSSRRPTGTTAARRWSRTAIWSAATCRRFPFSAGRAPPRRMESGDKSPHSTGVAPPPVALQRFCRRRLPRPMNFAAVEWIVYRQNWPKQAKNRIVTVSNGGVDMLDVTQLITRDLKTCGGEPVFQGTRVTLRTILASLAEGDDETAILKDFPTLTREHLRAAVAFAAASAVDDMPYANSTVAFLNSCSVF